MRISQHRYARQQCAGDFSVSFNYMMSFSSITPGFTRLNWENWKCGSGKCGSK